MHQNVPSPYYMGNERRQNEVEQIGATLRDHMRDEMEKYQELADMHDQLANKIEVYHQDSESRHNETQRQIAHLNQSIQAFMAESHDVFVSFKKAFPKDEEGLPDYGGHRKAHDNWIQEAKDAKEFRAYVKRVVTGAAAIAIVSWLVAVIWPAILQGPK